MTKFARAYIAVVSLQSFTTGWFFATYVLFLLEKGLSLFQANLLNLAFMTVNFLLDAPTGHLADRIGRKKIFIIGQVFWGLGMMLYGVGSQFPHFLLAEVTGAVGSSLMSGALDSWLRGNTTEEECHKVLSYSGATAAIATIPSALVGGLVAVKFGYSWPWLLAGISSALVVCIGALILKSLPEKVHGIVSPESLPRLTEVFRLVYRSGELRFAAAITFGTSLAFQAFNMFWSPIMKEVSGSAGWLGSLWIGIALATSLGSILANGKAFKINGRSLSLAIFLTGLPMLVTPFLGKHIALLVVFFLNHEIWRGTLNPVLFTYSNRHIPEEVRSTANSVRTTARTFGAAVGLLVSGLLTSVLTPLGIWGISAFALILLSLYAFKRG